MMRTFWRGLLLRVKKGWNKKGERGCKAIECWEMNAEQMNASIECKANECWATRGDVFVRWLFLSKIKSIYK